MRLQNNIKDVNNKYIIMFLIFYIYNSAFNTVIFGNRMISVIAFVLAVGMLVIKYIVANNFVFKTTLDISFVWIILACFSFINNQDLKNNTESRWILPIMCIIAMVVLKNSFSWHEIFVKSVRFFVLIHAFFTILFYLFKNVYLNWFVYLIPASSHTYLINKFKEGSMAGITSNYSTNGIYLGLGLLFFAVDFIYSYNKRTKNDNIKILLKLLFVFTALFLTTKRAHILFGLIAVIGMYYVYNSNKKTERWVYILSLVLLGFFVLLIGSQFSPAIYNVVDRFLNADGGEISNGRIWFWEFAIDKFKESPIFGVGWGGFKHEYFKVIGNYSSTTQLVDAHCVYLQILCEQGIIGLGLFLTGVLGNLKVCWLMLSRSRKKIIELENKQMYLLTLSLGIQLFFIMYCSTGNCLYDIEVFLIYCLACAMTLSIRLQYKRKLRG